AQVGPPVARGTRDRSWWPGRRLSRAIEKIRRPFVTMITRPQAKIDTQTTTRKIFCTGPPSTSRTIDATGAELAYAALFVAYASTSRNAKPTAPDSST